MQSILDRGEVLNAGAGLEQRPAELPVAFQHILGSLHQPFVVDAKLLREAGLLNASEKAGQLHGIHDGLVVRPPEGVDAGLAANALQDGAVAMTDPCADAELIVAVLEIIGCAFRYPVEKVRRARSVALLPASLGP